MKEIKLYSGYVLETNESPDASTLSYDDMKENNWDKCILVSNEKGNCPNCGTKLTEFADAKGLYICKLGYEKRHSKPKKINKQLK